MFAFRDQRRQVEVAFTDRSGGASTGSFAELNLAGVGADDPALVARNLDRVLEAFTGLPDTPVAAMRQVHGRGVAVVDAPTDDPVTAHDDLPVADALVTTTPGLTLLVRVADCVPVLLADPGEGAVAAVHAGRSGLVAGVVPAAVAALGDLGARQLTAWIGPSICGRCYEVPASMRDDVCAVVPQAWAETSWGTPAVDVGAGVRAQLAETGIQVVDAARCTRESTDLYSYRRDGDRSGRFAGLVRLRP